MVGGAEVEKPIHVGRNFADEMALFELSDEIADAPTEEDVTPDLYEVWPENLPAVSLFKSLENQWHIVATEDGEIIRTGMRLGAIELKLKYTNGVSKKQFATYFEQMEWMERAALAVMNAARAERVKKRIAEIEKMNQGR